MINSPAKIGISSEKTVVPRSLNVYLDANKLNSYSGTGGTWYDLSGNGKNAELTNTLYATVGTAKCLHINNTTDNGTSKIWYGNVKTTASDNGRGLTSSLSEFCLMMFVYPTFSSTVVPIYNESRTASWQNVITLTKWYTRDTSTGVSGGRNNDLTFSVPINQWTCIAANYSVSNSLKSIYINGSLTTSSSTSVDAITTNRNTSFYSANGSSEIGVRCDSDDIAYRGYIGNFLFYTSSLTANEIAYNFNVLRRMFSI
jgi:hypothetical protein